MALRSRPIHLVPVNLRGVFLPGDFSSTILGLCGRPSPGKPRAVA